MHCISGSSSSVWSGVAVLLLFPQVQAAFRSHGVRRTAHRRIPTEHEQRIAELRAAVQEGRADLLRARRRWRLSARSWQHVTPRTGVPWRWSAAWPRPECTQPSSRTTSTRRGPVGAFFLAIALAQAVWACLVCRDATPDRLVLAGIVEEPRPDRALGALPDHRASLCPRARASGRLGRRLRRSGSSWFSSRPAWVGLSRPQAGARACHESRPAPRGKVVFGSVRGRPGGARTHGRASTEGADEEDLLTGGSSELSATR